MLLRNSIRSVAVATAIALAPGAALATHDSPGPIEQGIPAGGPAIKLELVADGMTAPNFGISAPGDSASLYVTDQPGILWKVDLATGGKSVFLDVSGLIVPLGVFGGESFDERGLLSVAFHPDFQHNGLVYTFTSESAAGGDPDFSTIPAGSNANHHSVIREWYAGSGVVDPSSTRVIMRIAQPQFNHNSGSMNFEKHGSLVVTVGDGGGADDQPEADMQIFIEGPPLAFIPIIGHGQNGNAQNPGNILGSVIRIDPTGRTSANGQYSIPGDNPFARDGSFGGEDGCADGLCDEIYAFGFRNPWRASIDRKTGLMLLGDVGQNDIEEIDVVVKGGNYGWPLKEGSYLFDHNGDDGANGAAAPYKDSPNSPSGYIDPVAQYDHDEGVSVIGGFIYRGHRSRGLRDRYIFGEFSNVGFDPTVENCNGRLFSLNQRIKSGKNVEKRVRSNKFDGRIREFPGDVLGDYCLHGFGQDADGEVYALTSERGVPFGDTGAVYRIVQE